MMVCWTGRRSLQMQSHFEGESLSVWDSMKIANLWSEDRVQYLLCS